MGFPQQVDQTLSHEGPQQEEQDGLAGHVEGPPPLLLKDNVVVDHLVHGWNSWLFTQPFKGSAQIHFVSVFSVSGLSVNFPGLCL